LTVEELKDLLEARKIPKTGNKDELIDKLQIHLGNQKSDQQVKMDKINKKIIATAHKDHNLNGYTSENVESYEEIVSGDSDSSEDDDDSEESDSKKSDAFQEIKTDGILRKFKRRDFDRLTMDDLKNLLEIRNISRTGNKDDLVYKLKSYLKSRKEEKRKNKDKVGKLINKSKKIHKQQKLKEKTIDELKDLLKRKNLPVSGSKTELIERLIDGKKMKTMGFKEFNHYY